MAAPVTNTGLKSKESISKAFDLCFNDERTLSAGVIVDDSSNIDDFNALESTLSPILRALRWTLATRDIFKTDIPNLAEENFSPYKVHESYRLGYLAHVIPLELLLIRVSPSDIICFGKDIHTEHVAYALLNTRSKTITAGVGPTLTNAALGELHGTLLANYLSRDLAGVLYARSDA